MKNFKPSMICIIMMLPFLVLGKTTGIDSKSELPPPVASITNNTGTTILTCTTSAISVTAIGGTSYSWSGGSSTSTDVNSFTSPGTYTVTVTGSDASTATASISITQDITPPTAVITNNTGATELTCALTTISVTASPAGATFAWSGGATPASANNSFTTPGTYTVTVTETNGCTATSSITISTPTIMVSSNSPVCVGATLAISLTASSGGMTYAWSGPNFYTTLTQNPNISSVSISSSGTYIVTATYAGGCTLSAQTTVVVNPLPTAGITNNTGTAILTCSTTSISASAIPVGATSYLWSGGVTPATASNSFTAPDTYTVTVTGTNGCTSTSSIIITQDITPSTAAITNNSGTTILSCPSNTSISVTATPSGAESYVWDGGNNQYHDMNGLSSPGTYTVTVTAPNGCTSTSSIVIIQSGSIPTVTASSNSPVHLGEDINLTVSPDGATTYAWSGPSGFSSSLQNTVLIASSIPASLGFYTVTVTFAGGCTVSASTYVELETIYTTTNTGTTELNCSNTSISATAIDTVTSGTYLWNGGTSPNTATNTFTAPGTYTVTVSSTNGSTQTTSVTITQNIALPFVHIADTTGYMTITCARTSINATAEASLGVISYLWNGGNTNTTATNTFTAPGTYIVTVTAANGCTATSGFTITQNITPPTVGITNNTGATQLTCALTTISVTASPAGAASYAWSGGTTPVTANNSFTTPGTYTVTVTGTNGCTATSSIIITQDISVPTALVTSDSPVCVGSLILITSSGGVSYAWSGPNGYTSVLESPTIPAITTASGGVYTVTVTSAGGCTATAQTNIVVHPLPTVGITNNTGTTDLNAVIPSINVTATGGEFYLWSGGSSLNTATNDFTAPDTYTVTVTSVFGCTNTESVTITQVLNAPTNPVVTAINSTGATLDWDGTKGITTWDIRYKKLADANYTDIAGVTIKPYTVTGLESGTTYIWNVRSVRNSMTSDWSLDNTFTTTVGISDYAIDGLSIYYYNNRINMVNKDNILVKEMILYDMLGREVARYEINNTNQIGIDIYVSPANYIVKVVLDDRFGIYKMHVD